MKETAPFTGAARCHGVRSSPSPLWRGTWHRHLAVDLARGWVVLVFDKLKPVTLVKRTSNHVVAKNLNLERPLERKGVIHQRPAATLPMMSGIDKQPSDFITQKRNKADDPPCLVQHIGFRLRHIDLANSLLYLSDKIRLQERVC